jgi:CheY-like chemotaxis protein
VVSLFAVVPADLPKLKRFSFSADWRCVMERLPQTPAPRFSDREKPRLAFLAPEVPGSDGGSGHTVHIIQVDARKLLFLCDFLSVPGLRVTGSSDPARALNYVSRARPEVLICDLAMPQMGGKELLERTHQVSPETRVILTSDRVSHPVAEHVQRGGGVDLLLGPLSAAGLLWAVDRILRKGA